MFSNGVGLLVRICVCLCACVQLTCLLGASGLDWVAFIAAVCVSTHLLITSTLPTVQERLPTMGKPTIAAIAGVQILFGTVLKLYFFRTV